MSHKHPSSAVTTRCGGKSAQVSWIMDLPACLKLHRNCMQTHRDRWNCAATRRRAAASRPDDIQDFVVFRDESAMRKGSSRFDPRLKLDPYVKQTRRNKSWDAAFTRAFGISPTFVDARFRCRHGVVYTFAERGGGHRARKDINVYARRETRAVCPRPGNSPSWSSRRVHRRVHLFPHKRGVSPACKVHHIVLRESLLSMYI